ncbi:chondroitin sulfate N-acetylgalactosaminyltransferase 2 [Cephus cinctus]|uniref:Hexosyltransferase n=1 Tax=Cephus cinctus TaxID=211228 RepID=A0AAJ7C3G9_CEPCN|nr:chondroitin sulfate N-acetylgalactosaminyltransferase 2 [Cephus cinctus]XP_015600563.1 chondroitin sulfate N-acetylgalactosaminyltransferase 2 [Cephus cinctus]XP_024943342.1 chondroitin sulfate N-acetylgalactosaminyltransferase 2 [Cephus cinctus]
MTTSPNTQCRSKRRRDMMLRVLGVRLLSRLLVLVCSLSLLSLLFLSRCGFNNLDTDLIDTAGPVTTASLIEANQHEEETRMEVERLTAEIRSLKLQILQLTGGPPGHSETSSGINASDVGDCLAARRQVQFAEISQGLPLNNEYELIAFSHFTFSRLYPVDLGLGKRVVEKPIGFKRKDLLEALTKAIEILNKNVTLPTKYTHDDFLEGLYRVEPTTGTQYEMYFRTKNLSKSTQVAPSGYTKITLMRPYAPIQFIATERQQPKEKELIHIILPLSGRTNTFQSFMDKFVKIGLKNDRRVHLTVVYFGTEGLSEARAIMSRVLMTRGSGGSNHNLRLLALNETFSRGKGLRVGAERAWDGEGDVLLFMCDVDVVFSARFLDRCRWNTAPGRKVYYPIVFSLYNPHVVYTLQGREVPPETDQLVISRDTGFWRDFGYGMTCQYRSDFLRVRGFDEDVVGWGGEDVTLYRKYVKSNIKVVRATDPGIFHIWHPKVCSGGPGQRLSTDQYRACIRSRALNEASHAQLGFLAFREDIASQTLNMKSVAKKKKPSAKKEKKRLTKQTKSQSQIKEKPVGRTSKDQT